MLMSVNTILISSRLSKVLMASSAFDAQSGSNPAARIMSTPRASGSGLAFDREHHRSMGSFQRNAFPGGARPSGAKVFGNQQRHSTSARDFRSVFQINN